MDGVIHHDFEFFLREGAGHNRYHNIYPQEVIDLQDDHLMHRDEQEPQPGPLEPEPLEEVLTNDIEKDPPPTKAEPPRGKAQQEALLKEGARPATAIADSVVAECSTAPEIN